jgi:hypothetical protein
MRRRPPRLYREPRSNVTLLEAMARQEGFYAAGSRPERNNNPGDIEDGKFARAHGATGTDGRFAIFPDSATGFAAMRALLLSAYRGLTIQQALNKYAPPVENDTNTYLEHVCEWANLNPCEMIDSALEVA